MIPNEQGSWIRGKEQTSRYSILGHLVEITHVMQLEKMHLPCQTMMNKDQVKVMSKLHRPKKETAFEPAQARVQSKFTLNSISDDQYFSR